MDLKMTVGFVLRDFFEKFADGSEYPTNPLHNGEAEIWKIDGVCLGSSDPHGNLKQILEYVAKKSL